MICFQYAIPKTLRQVIPLLSSKWGTTEILAGGTDLLALMKDYVITPTRLVNIKKVAGIDQVNYTAGKGLRVGALVTMGELSGHPLILEHYPILAQVIGDAASPQIRNRATIGGNLCQRPRCWYFRNGFGLLALDKRGKSLVLAGENRYHAILGNEGPAYFVSPSTVGPTLIALGATITIKGPKKTRRVPLGAFYVTPTNEGQREYDLQPNEIVAEVEIPSPEGLSVAYYEVRQKHGFDWPYATATVVLKLTGGVATNPIVMMSHVAPTPWRSREAEAVLAGQKITSAVASDAAKEAVRRAKCLSENGYKITIARAAVERCIRQVAGLEPIANRRPSV